jgi:hypothetical protein
MMVGKLGPLGSFISGIVAGAAAAVAVVRAAFIRPLKKRLDGIEDDIDEVGGRAERADNRSESNEYILLGDDDDPNYPGVARDVKEIKEIVEEIRDEDDGDDE